MQQPACYLRTLYPLSGISFWTLYFVLFHFTSFFFIGNQLFPQAVVHESERRKNYLSVRKLLSIPCALSRHNLQKQYRMFWCGKKKCKVIFCDCWMKWWPRVFSFCHIYYENVLESHLYFTLNCVHWCCIGKPTKNTSFSIFVFHLSFFQYVIYDSK